MKYYCAKCGSQVTKKDLDDNMEVATCPSCNEIQEFYQLVKIDENTRTELAVTPPAGSEIDSYRYSDSVLEIYVPRKGFDAGTMASLTFMVFWLGFVAVWTFFAAMGSPLFALFSIPFWSVGFSMLYGVTKRSFEKQKLELNGRTLKLTKTRLLNSKVEEFPLMDIDKIDLEKMTATKHVTSMSKAQKFGSSKFKVPTIRLRKDKETFLEYASQEEKEWAVKLLKEYMYKVQGTNF